MKRNSKSSHVVPVPAHALMVGDRLDLSSGLSSLGKGLVRVVSVCRITPARMMIGLAGVGSVVVPFGADLMAKERAVERTRACAVRVPMA